MDPNVSVTSTDSGLQASAENRSRVQNAVIHRRSTPSASSPKPTTSGQCSLQSSNQEVTENSGPVAVPAQQLGKAT